MRAGGRGGAGGVKACERPPGGGRSTHHDDTVRLHCHVGQQRQQRQRVDQRCHDHRDKAPSCQGAAWSSVLVHSPPLAGVRGWFPHPLNACSRGGGARRQGAGEADGK